MLYFTGNPDPIVLVLFFSRRSLSTRGSYSYEQNGYAMNGFYLSAEVAGGRNYYCAIESTRTLRSQNYTITIPYAENPAEISLSRIPHLDYRIIWSLQRVPLTWSVMVSNTSRIPDQNHGPLKVFPIRNFKSYHMDSHPLHTYDSVVALVLIA